MKKHIDTGPLAALGMSPVEIKIYLALLELGSAKAGVLIQRTGTQSSVMYLTLGRLITQGYISYVMQGKFRVYQAVDPRQLIEIADLNKKNLEKMLPSLLGMCGAGDMPQAEVYEGVSGLKNMCFRFIEDAAPGDEYLFLGFSSKNPVFEEEVYGFYREFTETRMERGLKLKGVAHESMRKFFEEREWPHTNIRYVPFPILKNISICGNKTIIVPWETERVSFLISSEGFASNLREYFTLVYRSGA